MDLVTAALLLVLLALVAYIVVLHRRLAASERRLQQVVQRHEESRAVARRAVVDALTGVANRRHFDEALAREWRRAQRSAVPLSLLLVDIDHFKKHNDEHGHQAGDDCLRQVAAVLASGARRSADLVARYGGEEFAVLLPGIDLGNAAVMAERLRAAVEAIRLPYKDPATSRHVTVSVGVASAVPGEAHAPAALLAAADEALYKAKAVGRNQVISAAPLAAA